MPIYPPLDQFSPRRLISNLQYSKKHRKKASGHEFYCLMYLRGYVSHQDKLTRLTWKQDFAFEELQDSRIPAFSLRRRHCKC